MSNGVTAFGDSYYTFGVDTPKERVTLGVPCITTDHSLIHAGLAYTVTGSFAKADTRAAIGIKAPTATAASKTVAMADTDANLLYTAKTKGKDGNGWRVTHVAPAGATAALSVAVSYKTIVVNLAKADDAVTSTAAQVAAAVNASVAGDFIAATVPGDGAVVNAVAEQTLEGGADAVYLHFKPIDITSFEAVATIRLHEVATFSGEAVDPMWEAVNQNRVCSLTSAVTITSSAEATLNTTADDHEVLFTKYARGSAQAQARHTGSVGSPEEIVLKPGAQYVLEIERGNTAVDFQLFWYEEESA